MGEEGKNAGRSLNIDAKVFGKRLSVIYSSWKKNKEAWSNADALTVVTPPSTEDLRYLKSTAIHLWLFGYEFPEAVMVLVKGCVHVLCSKRKADKLNELQRVCKEVTGGIDMKVYAKQKGDDGSELIHQIIESITSIAASSPPVVGVLSKEPTEGELLERWMELLQGSGANLVDVAGGFADILGVKDDAEILNVKKAGFLSASTLKSFLLPKVEEIIDEQQKVTHLEISEKTEQVIMEPSKIGVKLKQDNCDICFPPVIQSGGVFNIRPSASSNKDNLYYDAHGVIICVVGARYASYCSNVARSVLIDASPSQEKAYKTLLSAQEAAIAAVKIGAKMSAPYNAALAVVERTARPLVQNLTKSAGTGIGLEFRESALSLNSKNERIIKPGMVFNISLGFQDLQNEESESAETKNYSLLIADTVLVSAEKGTEITTKDVSKAWTEVAYNFKEDDEDEEEENDRSSEPPVPETRGGTRAESKVLKTTLRSESGEPTKESERRQKQAELAKKKNEEFARRLAGGGLGDEAGPSAQAGGGADIKAYNNVDDVPTYKDLQIQVDQKNEAVLLPIYGLMVPFHISTIKNVTSQQVDASHMYIRINFWVPGSAFGGSYVPAQKYPDSIFVKEISYRSSDAVHAKRIEQLINTMRRSVKQREAERADRASLVTQEKLQLAKGRPPRLSDVWIRPPFGGRGRKVSGTLEAHANGFRYSTVKAEERVDIMYSNIKHAFFQPAEKEMITLVHFHLHNPIMVGNKKVKDVQFYAEVMEQTATLNGGRRSMYDPDEIEEEQRERERRNKINKEFVDFTRRVTEVWETTKGLDQLEFDVPFRELGFMGVPYKSTAFIMPTVNCLVELIETPFLVVSLGEIEVVNLERVGFNSKTFDLAIVFKDFKKDVHRIDAIPAASLDGIKEWLNSVDIKYYESKMNMSWKPILKQILADPNNFVEEGGWEFLNMEASGDEASSDESSGYQPSDASEEESSESDSDDESVVDSEDEEEASEEEESEEEGLSWDELEEQAKKADRERAESDDSEEERRRRKGKAPAPPPRGRVPPPPSRGGAPPPRSGGGAPPHRSGGGAPPHRSGMAPKRPAPPSGRSGPPPKRAR